MRAKTRIPPDWEKTDPNYRIERNHGAVLIERHNKLLAAGYRIDVPRSIDAEDIPARAPEQQDTQSGPL